MSKINAPVCKEVTWGSWPWVRLEVLGRADDRRSMVWRNSQRDHVLCNVFSEVNTGVKTPGHDVHPAVIGGDIQHDFRVLPCELAKLWCEDRRHRKARYQ